MHRLLLRLTLLLALLPLSTLAQDEAAARRAAADRYLAAVPVARMLDEMYDEIAKQVPPDKRGELIATLRKTVRIEGLERSTRDAMVKVFSADELNALADFYRSRHGASAMKKFGAYMAEVMPPLMQEIERAASGIATGK